jgi:hypothetical protein
MPIGVIAAVVVVAVAVSVAALLMRRSQDDVHSVEHYHRQLHTLEEIRSHPSGDDVPRAATGAAPGVGAGTGAPDGAAAEGRGAEGNGTNREAYPARAFRVSGSRTVRLTDLETPNVLPAPPLAVPNPDEPVKFDDTGAGGGLIGGGEGEGEGEGPVGVPQTSFMRDGGDKAMHSIDHRPRRLGAPLAAVGVVTVLIVVLIVTGLHSDTKPPKHGSSSTATTVHNATTVPAHGTGHGRAPTGGGGHRAGTTTTTTTTAPPAVSAATAATPHAATYDVSAASYSLSLAASSGECWVEAENPATGTVLFSGTLFSGQSHIVSASGPVVVIAGAPGAFAATINGVPVTLPPGYQAPFTLTFQTPGVGGDTSTAPTTTSTT